jgi:hypothetical protein
MLDKAIIHGQEYREPYRRSKRFDLSCRNHGKCSYCYNNRTIKNRMKDNWAKEDCEETLRKEINEIIKESIVNEKRKIDLLF